MELLRARHERLSEGHAVLDIARAAQRLTSTGLSTSTPVGLMGYSQGGGAAGWAAELAATYAPELKVKGSAIGGVPANLAATAEFLAGSPFVAFALTPASARFRYALDDASVTVHFDPRQAAHCVRRSTLDPWRQDTPEQAGATLRFRRRVVDPVRAGERVSGVVVNTGRCITPGE